MTVTLKLNQELHIDVLRCLEHHERKSFSNFEVKGKMDALTPKKHLEILTQTRLFEKQPVNRKAGYLNYCRAGSKIIKLFPKFVDAQKYGNQSPQKRGDV